ncbi:hypothetical protein HM002_02710 [Candidatus Bathyarchaeota archaeon A05DMB-4]|nr:hypothetical protein [Candidatus Bathyarchaeota archaeon A05DMB-4]
MNKKYALVSIALIALMSLSLVPTFAFHTPSSTDDNVFEAFGPRVSQILIKVYTDYTTELAGFKAKEIDIMDWGLEPIDYQWFETNDPTHAQYSTAFYVEFGAFQYDINNQVLPTSIQSVRQAIAHLIDKQYFINTYLAGMGQKLDSVLAYLGTGWYNPGCTDLYNLAPRTTMTPTPDDVPDWEAAIDLLLADLPVVEDPAHPGEYMFFWDSPFDTPDSSGTFPAVADGHLLVFARSEMTPRTQQGIELENYLEQVLPEMSYAYTGTKYRMYVDLYIRPRSVTSPQVMGQYRYHLYTGGWSLGRDPDFLVYYTSGMIDKPEPYGNNYVMYANPDFDYEVDQMLISSEPGSPSNPSDGVYHAWLAQEIMETDEPVIWVWSFAGYKAALSNWRGVVNGVGVGLNSWWTFMNAYKLGGTGYGDIIRYGWAGDLLSLNVISAQWLWDWDVLGKVYDALIAVNPYNVAEDLPWIATDWEAGTWDYTPGGGETTLLFDLRTDVYWQNIPYHDRSEIAVGNGDQIDGPFEDYVLTPVDVVFSWKYQADNILSWNGWLAEAVVKVGLNPTWQSLWPYDTALPPWWDLDPADWNFDYVEWDPALAENQLMVYFDVPLPWLALHWVGGIPLIPMHLWSQIPISTSGDIDAWQYDLVYGCGPFILLSRTPAVQNVLISFTEGQSYRGTTITHGFWNVPVGETITMLPGGAAQSIGWTETRTATKDPVSYEVKLAKTMKFRNTYPTAVTVSYYFDYRVEVWNGANWVAAGTGQTTTATVEVPAGGSVIVAAPATFKVSTFGKIRIYESYHWEWTYGTTHYSITFETPVAEVFLNVAADVNGDGIVNISDVNLLLANWQKRWYW